MDNKNRTYKSDMIGNKTNFKRNLIRRQKLKSYIQLLTQLDLNRTVAETYTSV